MNCLDDNAIDATTPADGDIAPQGVLPRGAKVGRYEIVRVIGRGGMGVVYAAYDPQLDRQVALKVLHSGGRTASLIAEAKALARLDDPHVVHVFDAGEHAGEVFIAMQLVIGDDLRTVLAKRRASPADIVRWFTDAGRGLVAAHAAGLVHRDFKPGNVLLDRRGRVAVTDFGLALDTLDPAEPSRAFAGTPLYMAPEQHALEPATAASDQFAFCVAMWEALFGQHPYVDRAVATSPALIGQQITDGPLIAPPRGRRVPRTIVEALQRGLAKRPVQRWPSMAELIAQLAPHHRRKVWPIVAAAVGSAVLVGGGFWLVERGHVSSCRVGAEQALARAWSPARATVQRIAFLKSQRPYAAAAATRTADALDKYAARWRELSVATCSAESTAAGSELLVKKRACLDASLDRWRALDGVLETGTPEVVDHASEALTTLADLGDCSDPKTIMASPEVPSRALAPAVRALRADLDRVAAEQATGSPHTLEAARGLVSRAEKLGWAPGIARAHIALGEALALAYLPALDELARGAELAIASHLDRDAIHAWTRAFGEAAYEQKPDALGMLITEARSTAQRLGDPAAAIGIEVAYARALVQTQRGDDALAICKAAIATAQKLGNRSLESSARDCVFEALVPAGKLEELHQVAAERLAFATETFGPDAPQIATYEELLADTDLSAGNLAAARAEIDRAVALIYKAFPSGKNPKVAEILQTRAAVEAAEGKTAAAVATLRSAREVALAFQPRATMTLATIDTLLSELVSRTNDTAGAKRYLEEAIAAVRAQGSRSVALAMLLLNYGQVLAATDVDGALRTFGEARAMLEALHDPRASYAAAAMAATEVEAHRWVDARAHAEEAVAFAAKDPAAVPANTAEMQFALAQALVETHGDKKRALQLARTARATLASLGPGAAPMRTRVDRWLAKHR